MSNQNIALLALTFAATGAIVADRFVTGAGAQTVAAGNAIGVARNDAAIGEKFTADVIGTAIVEAGAAVAANALVEADAAGRAVTKAAGVTLGRALQAAGAAGQKIEVLLIQN